MLSKNPEAFGNTITEAYIDKLLNNIVGNESEKIRSLKTLRLLSGKNMIPESRKEKVSGLIWNEAELNRYGIIHYIEGSTDIWTLGRKL